MKYDFAQLNSSSKGQWLKCRIIVELPSLGWYEKSFEALSVVSNSLHNIWEVMIPPIALGKSSKISLKQISNFSSSTIYPKLPCRLLVIALCSMVQSKNIQIPKPELIWEEFWGSISSFQLCLIALSCFCWF